MSNALLARVLARGIRRGSRTAVPGYLGGVAAPVSAGGGDPADGGGGLEVEDLSQDGSGEFAGEVHQSGAAGGHGGDAEAAKPLAESAWVERTSGVQAGDKPAAAGR